MPSLHSRQYEFAQALLNPQAEAPAGLLGPEGRHSATRFSVYRNNVFVGLIDSLRDVFPAVCRLVGNEFFQAMARTYVIEHPPVSPVLLYYGSGFAKFLADFEPVRDLPYLGDVAAMEYAWIESYHAAEAEPLPVGELAGVSSEDLPGLRFWFHPSVRVLSSAYPALTIWRMNQGDLETSPVDLAAGGEDVLIARPVASVEVRRIDAMAAMFLRVLMEGATVLEAMKRVLHAFPVFNPTQAIAMMLEAEILCGFTPASADDKQGGDEQEGVQ